MNLLTKIKCNLPVMGSIWKWSMWTILLAGGVIKILLISGQHLLIIGYASYDDRHFIDQAAYILHGQWLGPYNNFTLIKGPFYPLYIALVSLTHIPLLISEHLLYFVSCLVFLISIWPLVRIHNGDGFYVSLRVKYIIFTILGLALIFNPITSDIQPGTRVIREGIYPSLTLLTVSSFISLVSYRKSKLWKYVLISLGGGIVLSGLWLTREEGVWILPFVIGMSLYIIWLLVGQKKEIAHWKWRIAIIALPFTLLWGSIFIVSSINYHYYGVRSVVEVTSPQFVAAYSSLTRVKGTKWYPVIPVSAEQRKQIYSSSPAFSKLEPLLEGDVGKAWANISSGTYPQYPGEIAGGWFPWAFRQAVSDAGYYTSGQTAMNYYSTVANQINDSCRRGKLACNKSTGNIYPPLDKRYLKPFISTFSQSFLFLTGFQQYIPKPVNITSDAYSNNLFSQITHERATNIYGHRKVKLLTYIGTIYQKVFPILTYISVGAYILLLFLKRSYSNPLFIVIGLIGMTIVVRMILLSLITITSFPAINTLYFSCAYPLLIIFDVMSLLMLYLMVCDIRSKKLNFRYRLKLR